MNLKTCSDCWAVVEEQHWNLHLDWHRQIDAFFRDASYAAGMMRPLGGAQ